MFISPAIYLRIPGQLKNQKKKKKSKIGTIDRVNPYQFPWGRNQVAFQFPGPLCEGLRYILFIIPGGNEKALVGKYGNNTKNRANNKD